MSQENESIIERISRITKSREDFVVGGLAEDLKNKNLQSDCYKKATLETDNFFAIVYNKEDGRYYFVLSHEKAEYLNKALEIFEYFLKDNCVGYWNINILNIINNYKSRTFHCF